MESQDIYLTLPSTASLEFYPENTISDFKVNLAKPINVENYEVGLAEILLNTDIENVTSKQIAFVIYRDIDYIQSVLKIKSPGGYVENENQKYIQEIFYIKRGKYNSLTDVINYFNVKFLRSRISKDLFFSIYEEGGNTLLSLQSLKVVKNSKVKSFQIILYDWFLKSVIASNNMALQEDNLPTAMLKNQLHLMRRLVPNFDNYLMKMKVKFTDVLFFLVDTRKLLQSPGHAYIYADIIETQYVGDSFAPLLRVVNFEDGVKSLRFTKIHYVSFNTTVLNSVRIYTRDITGSKFAFTDGNIMLKLHLRRKKTNIN